MDYEALPDETERSIVRLDKADLRTELSTGWGATSRGMVLTQRYHGRLTEGVRTALLGARTGKQGNAAPLVLLLKDLPPEVLALSCIQTVLHSIGQRDNLRNTLIDLGTAVANECWAKGLTKASPRLAQKIERAVRLRKSASTTARRFAAAKASVERAKDKLHSDKEEEREDARALIGFKERIWSRVSLMTAGAWLWNVLTTSLPEVFKMMTIVGTTESMVVISEGSWAIVDEMTSRTVDNTPVFWPSAIPPKPWEDFTGGGSHDVRVNRYVTVVRTNHRDTKAAVKHAIKTGTMKPALDALNALQSVPFKINTKVLEVIQVCEGARLPVKGLVPADITLPKKPNAFAWDDMGEAEQRLWKIKRDEKRKANAGFNGDRVVFSVDMAVACEMAKHDAFYTPMNLDWRGRVYALCSFNFQREDRVRALFNFAEGMPIGEEGLRWLKIHTANTGDFNVTVGGVTGKISKRPLEERVQWCNDNITQITNTASAPLVHTEWMGADKPFLHLAACFELAAALEQGSSFMTHLPISFDGSCSGLQHLSAMTRAEEGAMVNLTPSPLPQDVYQEVADATFVAVTADLMNKPDPDADDAEAALKASNDIRAMARLFLDYDGDWRKLVKRNVMTYSYSSRKFGMSSQQQVDLMEPLAREVLEGSRAGHPFVGYCHGHYNKHGVQQPSKAARYIASRVFAAIEARIKKPAEAMAFLQSIAKTMAHEGKPVTWTTPVGLPWINRYHAPEVTEVKLYLVDRGVKQRARFSLTTGSKKEIDKAKAANGVAPNFVHALDAAHLLLVSNAAGTEGITSIATVHDSFGCLAPQAAAFNRVIREQFKQMYENHDVLSEILERATAELTEANHGKLPILPSYGSLNLRDILHADFAFA